MGLRQGLVLAVLLPLLGGCAGPVINDSMEKMLGKDIGQVIAKLGYPDSEVEVAGRRYYTWSHRNTGSYSLPQYQTKTVTSYGPSGPTTNTYSYMTYETVTYDDRCNLRIFVDDQERIIDWEVAGNSAGCWTYASRLSD